MTASFQCALGFALGAFALATPALAAADTATVESVVVTGKYSVEATKSSAPLIETPRNIQVISSALIQDQGDTLLEDALRNVAGVMPGGYYQGFDYFRIRGFDASGFIYLDNLKYDTNVTTNVELFGLDQIEVVKGPSSGLYGQGSLGGLVNLVSKRPKPQTFASLTAGGGSFGTYEISLDAGTVFDDNDELYGRVAAVVRQNGTFFDYANGLHRTYIAPSLTYRPDADTTITFLPSYQHDNMYDGFPLPARGFILPDINGKLPVSRFIGEPGDSDKLSFTRTSFGYDLDHQFTSWLSLHQNLRYVFTNSRWRSILYPAYLDTDTAEARTLYRYPFSLTENTQIFGVDTALEFQFSTDPLSHTVDAGIDYFRDNDSSFYHQIDYSDPSGYIGLDLYNPVYGTPIPEQPDVAQSLTHINNTGLYAQDHVVFGDFTLTAGLRWDSARTTSGYAGVITPSNDYALVPNVGVTYALQPGVVAYASYSESFEPQNGMLLSGGGLSPERGRQWEAGIKLSLLNGRANATAAVYQLTRSNVSTSDIAHPGFSVQTGEQQSRGVELDAQAVLAPGWQMVLGYTYVDAKVTRDNVFPIGDHPQNAPPQSLALWTKYTIQGGALQGLGASLGGYFYASQWGDLPNTFKLPGYALVNGGLSYTFGRTTLAINVDNLLDQRYATGSYNDIYVNPGAPRSVLARVTWAY